jgi:protein subunit release factor A
MTDYLRKAFDNDSVPLKNIALREAHDRIEKLEAEVERLVKSRNKWGKLYNQTLEKLRLSVMSDSEYVKIIDEKCAEQADRIEKLEAALRRWLVSGCRDCGGDCGSANPPVACCIVEETRKALEGKDD